MSTDEYPGHVHNLPHLVRVRANPNPNLKEGTSSGSESAPGTSSGAESAPGSSWLGLGLG
jgi:hypothetical protein